MSITTVFTNNRSQAVRLPKDVAFPAGVREVRIVREGKRRVIAPADAVSPRRLKNELLTLAVGGRVENTVTRLQGLQAVIGAEG